MDIHIIVFMSYKFFLVHKYDDFMLNINMYLS